MAMTSHIAHMKHAVTNPTSLAPADLQSNWAALKAARGQQVHLSRLSVTAHLITPAAPDIIAFIDATRDRVADKVRGLTRGPTSTSQDGQMY